MTTIIAEKNVVSVDVAAANGSELCQNILALIEQVEAEISKNAQELDASFGIDESFDPELDENKTTLEMVDEENGAFEMKVYGENIDALKEWAVECVNSCDSNAFAIATKRLEVWAGVLGVSEEVGEFIKTLDAELTAGVEVPEIFGKDDDMNIDGAEQQVEESVVQSGAVLKNADVVSAEQVQQVKDAAQKVTQMTDDITKVASAKVVKTPSKTVRQIEGKLGLGVFNVARYFYIHFTGAQMRAVNGNLRENAKGMVDFSSLQEALANDPVFASNEILPGKNRNFRESLFGKIIKTFQMAVRHWSAVQDFEKMNLTADLWKAWHNAYGFKGNISQKIEKAISNPEKYDFDAAKSDQEKRGAVAAKNKLGRKFDGGMNGGSKK